MSSMRKQEGFSLVEAGLALLVVALIGFLGWTFYQTMTRQDDSQGADTVKTESPATADESATPAVENTSDLDDAEKFLDDTDVDEELSTSDIDSALKE